MQNTSVWSNSFLSLRHFQTFNFMWPLTAIKRDDGRPSNLSTLLYMNLYFVKMTADMPKEKESK
jgi:hypothetical protein